MNVEKCEVNDDGSGTLIVSNDSGGSVTVLLDVLEQTAEFQVE